MPHALIVEDDPNSLSGLTALLAADGFSVDTATSLAEARTALGRSIPDVVLVDLNLPDGSGFDLLQHLPQQQPNGSLPVIVLTGNATVESAIEGLRHGIWDYLLKPINIPRLRSLLARIPRPYELIDEVQSLRASLRHLGRFGSLVGRSDAMQHVYDMIEHNAGTETAVLFSGEAGTGKKLAARTLHELSRRRKGPFVSFDCRMIAQAGRHGASLDSVLFGHERGAFDGAERRDAVAEIQHAVERVQQRIQFVRGEQHGDAELALHVAHEFDDAALVVRVEADQRFVEQQQLRIAEQALREQQALPFAARQLRQRPARERRAADEIEHAIDVAARGRVRVRQPPAVAVGGHRDEVVAAHPAVQIGRASCRERV